MIRQYDQATNTLRSFTASHGCIPRMRSHVPPSSQYSPLLYIFCHVVCLSHFPHTLYHILFGVTIFTRNLGPGSSPSEDAQWIREELHRWIHGRLHYVTATQHSICPHCSLFQLTRPHFLPLHFYDFLSVHRDILWMVSLHCTSTSVFLLHSYLCFSLHLSLTHLLLSPYFTHTSASPFIFHSYLCFCLHLSLIPLFLSSSFGHTSASLSIFHSHLCFSLHL